jgi:Fe-S-cluster-containing hydrogenase component 2
MKVQIYFKGMEPKAQDEISSHIRSKWPEVIIYADNTALQTLDVPIALVIGKSTSPITYQNKPLLTETIEVDDTAPVDEICFRIDAKLGKLTKSDKLFSRKLVSSSRVMSRREFFRLGLATSHPNDLPMVSTDCCEAKFGCSKCVDACPSPGALKIENNSIIVADEYCIRCGLCAGICPVAAIEIPQLTEDAYQGLVNAIKFSSAPTRTLVITCNERCVPRRPWMDIEEVPGIGIMGVRQIATAAASVDVLIVHCADGKCAAKENIKHALTLISSLSGKDGPTLRYLEGNLDSAILESPIKSPRPRKNKSDTKETPWKDYVNSIRTLSSNLSLATDLGLTSMTIAESCTLCNACVESCPHQALAIQNENLNFTSEACTGCGFCAEICPENSITLSKMSGPIELTPKTVYRDEMIKCVRCHIPFVSAKMMKKVSGIIPESADVITLCPKCKQDEIYQRIYGNSASI